MSFRVHICNSIYRGIHSSCSEFFYNIRRNMGPFIRGKISRELHNPRFMLAANRSHKRHKKLVRGLRKPRMSFLNKPWSYRGLHKLIFSRINGHYVFTRPLPTFCLPAPEWLVSGSLPQLPSPTCPLPQIQCRISCQICDAVAIVFQGFHHSPLGNNPAEAQRVIYWMRQYMIFWLPKQHTALWPLWCNLLKWITSIHSVGAKNSRMRPP